MAVGYRLSLDAEEDLGELYRRGYWRFGEREADKFYEKLHDTFDLLASFPLSGTSANSIYPGLRRVEFAPYVIFYLKRDYGVYISRIIRHSQAVRKEFFTRSMEKKGGFS